MKLVIEILLFLLREKISEYKDFLQIENDDKFSMEEKLEVAEGFLSMLKKDYVQKNY